MTPDQTLKGAPVTVQPPEPTPDEPIGVEEVRDFLWDRLGANVPSLYAVTVCADGTAALALEIRRYWQTEARTFRVTVEALDPAGEAEAPP